MRYTTIIWEPPITTDQTSACRQKLDELAARGVETTLTEADEGTRQVCIRSWPDLANAEEWCEFALGIACSSASVDPV